VYAAEEEARRAYVTPVWVLIFAMAWNVFIFWGGRMHMPT